MFSANVAEVIVDDILGEGEKDVGKEGIGKDVEKEEVGKDLGEEGIGKEGVDLKVNFFKGKPGNRDHLVSGI